jgi:hypothetical protein
MIIKHRVFQRSCDDDHQSNPKLIGEWITNTTHLSY